MTRYSSAEICKIEEQTGVSGVSGVCDDVIVPFLHSGIKSPEGWAGSGTHQLSYQLIFFNSF